MKNFPLGFSIFVSLAALKSASDRDETTSATNHFPQSHMRKILEADISQNRQARILNALGTVLKYITGAPDHDDFERVINIGEQLIDSQGKQLTDNTEVQKEINSLTLQ